MDSYPGDSGPSGESSPGSPSPRSDESGVGQGSGEAPHHRSGDPGGGEETDGGLDYAEPDPEQVPEEEEEAEPEDEEAADTAASPSPAPPAAPVAGPGQHVVQQGETLISLGHRFKIDPQAILDHPENRHLVERGRGASILNPGDLVTLPERSAKSVSCSTDRRHRFVYSGGLTTLKMKFFGVDGPLANEPYRLEVGDEEYEGQLDGDGGLEVRIPADAQRGTIHIGANGEQVMEIGVGHLNPASEISGIQMRLNNLGYPCGNEDGEAGPHTRAAIRKFQADNDLEETGEIDDPTRDQLRQKFGC